jgi:hypothetical protein
VLVLSDMGKLVHISGGKAPLVDSGITKECPLSSLFSSLLYFVWNFYIFRFIGGI